jgi:hypothetical protein
MVPSQPEQIALEISSRKKNASQKRAGGVAEGMALSSNPSTAKTKQQKNKQNH